MSNVAINITSQFTGAPAFKKAGKASSGLEKGVKKLGVAMIAAFSVQAITSFGKAAVKAFMDDQKAAANLANTLKNLGLNFAVAANEEFISGLEKATSVSDDKLRPALGKLITQTGSLTYAQDLLTQAIEISRGSGIDLETVTADLGAAFVGNTKGLKKYSTGLTTAQLAGMSFEQIMTTLNGQFAGSNAAYLATYAGQMDALTVASGNASETIGKGLLESLNILVGGTSNSIGTVTDSMSRLAEGSANFFVGIASYVRKIWDNPIFQKLIKVAEFFIRRSAVGLVISAIVEEGAKNRTEDTTPVLTDAQKAFLAEQKARAAAQAKLIRSQKAANELAKKQAAEELKRKKAGSIFDIEQIGLVAALKGNLSEEDRKRVSLQMALLTGNTSEATKLAGEIAKSQGLTKDFVAYYSGIPNAKDPFAGWILSLELAAKLAADIARGNYTVAAPTYNAAVLDTIASTYGGADGGMAGFAARADAGNVNVYIGGSVVSENDLVEAVSNGLLNRSLSGSASAIGRLKGSFAG
jgi:hypothetical protein